MFAHSYERVVEWGECDPAGIVFYPSFFAMFDAATAQLLQSASGMSRILLIREHGIIGWPMVDTRSVFHSPVRFDDRIRIESRITRIGRSRFDVAHALYRGSERCVEATEARVWAAQTGEGIRATPIPDSLREKLEAKP